MLQCNPAGGGGRAIAPGLTLMRWCAAIPNSMRSETRRSAACPEAARGICQGEPDTFGYIILAEPPVERIPVSDFRTYAGPRAAGTGMDPAARPGPSGARRSTASMRLRDGLRRRDPHIVPWPAFSHESVGRGRRIAVCRSAPGCRAIAEPCAGCRSVYIFRTDSACKSAPLQAEIGRYLFHISF